MTNIERAIERLGKITRFSCDREYSEFPTVNLNDCRAEIVALMRELSNWYEELHPDTLAALAAKILEGEKL